MPTYDPKLSFHVRPFATAVVAITLLAPQVAAAPAIAEELADQGVATVDAVASDVIPADASGEVQAAVASATSDVPSAITENAAPESGEQMPEPVPAVTNEANDSSNAVQPAAEVRVDRTVQQADVAVAEETVAIEDTAAQEVADASDANAVLAPASSASEDASMPSAEAAASGEVSSEVSASSTSAPAASAASLVPAEPAPAAKTEASSSSIVDKMNVYRLYNPQNGEHLYTKDLHEAEAITEQRGWQWEGVGFTASSSKGQAVWRLYDSATGLHLWTTDAWERRVLLTQRRGWSDEGLAWYGAGPYRLTRLFDPRSGQHLYTRDAYEARVLSTERGWTLEAEAGTWSTGSASDYVPIKARWLTSSSWGVEGGRYWVQSNGNLAKSRYVNPSEGTGYSYNVYVVKTGNMLRNAAAITGGQVVRADSQGRIQSSLTGTGDAELDRMIATIIKEHTGTDSDAARKTYDYVRTSFSYRHGETRTTQADQNSWAS